MTKAGTPPPLGLVEFLREVCVEETAEEARSQRWRAQGIPKRAQTREIQAEQDDPNPFLKELGQIKTQLQALQMPPAAQPPPAVSTTPPTDMAAIVKMMEDLKGTVNSHEKVFREFHWTSPNSQKRDPMLQLW